MSDPIAEAAAHLSDAAPSSTEPQQPAPGSGEAGNAQPGTSPTDIAATISMVTVDAGSESQANSSITSIGTEPSPVGAEIETRPLETKTYADGSSATGYGLPDVSPIDNTTLVVASAAGNADAGTSPAGAATPANTGNVLLNAAPVVDAPVLAETAVQAEPEPEPMAREWHLMSLEAKFASALAKLRNAERVSVDELGSIYVHIKAVI